MTTDELQLLREFRAGIPVPDDLTRRTVYAYATGAGSSGSQPFGRFRVPRWRSRRGGLVLAIAVLALAGTAVSVASHSLFGLSNHGTRVHAGPAVRGVLNGHVFVQAGVPYNAQRPDSWKRLARRQGIGIYTARTIKGNHLCYYVGRRYREKLYLDGYGCAPFAGELALPARFWTLSGQKAGRKENAWFRSHPFPSPTRPVLILSLGGGQGEYTYLQPVGLAADGVRSIQMLALLDCHPVVTVPVIDNAFIDANPLHVAESFLVARNANGKVIWHSAPLDPPNAYVRTPLDRKVPRECGFK